MKIDTLIKVGLSSILLIGFIGCGDVEVEDVGNNNSSENQEEALQDNTAQINEENIDENSSPFLKVKEVYDGDTLSVGTFSSFGLNFYKLEMPKKGNLVSDSAGSIYLYDKDLNPLNIKNEYSNSINGTVSLDAGSYIIKFDHHGINPNYSKNDFTLNSNALFDQNNLPIISKGTHSGVGIQFYLIKVIKKGNLVSDSAGSIYLYDKDLNPLNIKNEYSNSINGTVSLDAGSYIIKFNHHGINPNYSKNDFTLNSNVLQ